jgi:hypothetical protein
MLEEMKDLFEWTSVRWEKCLTLYELAKQATGPIVELGAYDGNGTIALALGSKAGNGYSVYAIDQWQRFTGLYQQQFYPEDRGRLIENASKAGVVDIIKTVQEDAARPIHIWTIGPAALVIWDISLPRLFEDWQAWHPHIAPGGLFVGKDTTVWDFGWQQVQQDAIERGWIVELAKMEACLWGVRKPG